VAPGPEKKAVSVGTLLVSRFAREESVLKIAVLTSGGAAPGMNAALRAAAQEVFSRGWEVLAVEEGYYGLLEGEIRPVDRAEL
jgi:6-phosphofructokinase